MARRTWRSPPTIASTARPSFCGERGSVQKGCEDSGRLLPVGGAKPLTMRPALISGSPFSGPGLNSNVAVLSPDDTKLFVSNQASNTVTVFSVDGSGALTVAPGSPFAAPGSLDPSGMATDQAGTFLYSAAHNNQINGFSIAPNGALTSVPGSPFGNVNAHLYQRHQPEILDKHRDGAGTARPRQLDDRRSN